MKHTRLIAGTTLGLFLIGLISGPFVLQWTEKFIGKEIVGFTTVDWLVPSVSLGSLFAFCAICAGCLLWAYSKTNFEYAQQWVFGLDLLISLVVASIAVVLKLLQLRFLLAPTGNELDIIPMLMGAVNYFSLGYALPLSVNVILIAVLLWLSRQRKDKADMNVPVHIK